MRKRILEGAIALIVLIAGVGIVGALVADEPSDAHDESVTMEQVATTATTSPPGPSLAEFADAVNLASLTEATHAFELAEFARAYQAHLDTVARQQAAARRPATPAPVPRQYVEQPASVPSGSVWDRLAQCEAGGNWATHTANGFSGGLQFADATWRGFGGLAFAPMAWQASREQQIVVAEAVLASSGWRAWPACSSKLGLR